MAQIITPQRKPSSDGADIGEIGGAIIGGVMGAAAGGVGAAPGALAGAQIGKMGGGMLDNQQNQSGPQAAPTLPTQPAQPAYGADAMQRRQQDMETDKVGTLQAAEQAAYQLPEQDRQQYLPALTRARMLAQSGGPQQGPGTGAYS